MKPLGLLKNVRFYVLCFSFILSAILAIYVNNSFEGAIKIIRITQAYALTSVAFLYLTLLAGPFVYNFETPWNGQFIKARRALGVSAFYFAFLHFLYAFFGEIGGLSAFLSLDFKYMFAALLNLISLIILAVMAATANDYMIKKLKYKKWKFIHRFVYVVAVFTLIHALLLGEHFQSLNIVSISVGIASAFMIYLQGKRVIANLKTFPSGKQASK
jgi:sulfoxide reductase heme-binding subunit YedZ